MHSFASTCSRSDVSGNLCFCLSVDQRRECGVHWAPGEGRRQRGRHQIIIRDTAVPQESPDSPCLPSSSPPYPQLQEALITDPHHYDKAQAQRGLIPGLGRSPGERHGNPLQYFCLENPLVRGAWQAAVGLAQSWT